MSGKVGGVSFSVLLADGYNLLSAKPKTFSHKIDSIMEKSDGLGDNMEAESPVGLVKVTLTQGGAFFDDQANGMHVALNASQAVSRLLAWAFAGNTIGQPFIGTQGVYAGSYDVLGQVKGLTKANVTYTMAGLLDRGTILQVHGALTATGNGASVDYTLDTSQRNIPITSATKANPSVVTTTVPHGLTSAQKVFISGNSLVGPAINGDFAVTVISATTFSVPVNTSASSGAGTGGTLVLSSTVNGSVGHQQVSAFSGFTGVIGKIQHSPDDSTWADLITFANVTTAPIAERLTSSGTVDRYTRYVRTVTGSGSLTPFVGLARNA